MQWQDKGIILSAQKYAENSAIVAIFTPQYGIRKGLVRSVSSKKNRGIYQPGNIVDATWRGRLEEQLGNFSCELVVPIPALCLYSQLRLAVISSVCVLLERLLPEHDPHPTLFSDVESLLIQVKLDHHWQPSLVFFELELLSQCGFRLELSECAVTGRKDALYYVSPKTGRAVCQEAGLPYHEKLLRLPEFLIKNVEDEAVPVEELQQGLRLSRFFIEKYLFSQFHHDFPHVRTALEQLIV